ncbi:hypothetical protein HYC85_026636 [Camellia sinensis]|uniref:Peptidase S8/S53 domain-containing protein n=1 Tax=Camellia sinensis TaxID=4442 RepID=A0A7J7G4L9_CAMSI|nr:hypothetical protein HYC85_026636 [Camellia sinensis]
MKDLGPLNYFLGLEIFYDSTGSFLSQAKYTSDLLTRAGLTDCKIASTPLEPQSRLTPLDGTLLSDATLYRQLVDSLVYLTITRPDIAYVVHIVSQFMSAPHTPHYSALVRTLFHGLHYSARSSLQLRAFSDVNWAGDPTDRRSTTGFCFFLGDSLISWHSKKQSLTAHSSTEAEYRALADTTQELLCLRWLLADIERFVTVRPQRILPLHTTRTPSFLGLHKNLGVWLRSNYGKGVIVGLLDTGITPNHPSFSDERMPPLPTKWKGKCELNRTTCNKKLIGARSFLNSETSLPIDDFGHGTHTASTAVGNFVEGANLFGQANGTASGMAPLAHLAMYKVCGDYGCAETDILAAMDTVVEEGVDILSLSLGGPPGSFYDDAIALGAFGAIKKDVFVSCSAGNSGPFNTSLSNEAPWILTVSASTLDRQIQAQVVLGNNDQFNGQSLFQPTDFPPTQLPLVYAGMYSPDSAFCAPGSLDHTDVKGKVVLCQRGGNIGRVDKGQTVKDAGGAAMILMNAEQDEFSTIADLHVLPASHVSYFAGAVIKEYINSTATPTAIILFKGTVFGDPSAPTIASFSSRGPSFESPGILKPDIIGPGVSILAAWPYSVESKTNIISTFNMISGSSMSYPHLSGIAALLKSAHPDWSPAAIKSAIMTTADQLNLAHKPITDESLQ